MQHIFNRKKSYVVTRPAAATRRTPRKAALACAALAALLGAPAAPAQTVIDGNTTVTVPGDHASPWNLNAEPTAANRQLHIGVTSLASPGVSALKIVAGGQVLDYEGYVAYGADSRGAVTVDGAGSAWRHSSSLSIGHYGDGTLSITNGAGVFSSNAMLSSGTVDVGYQSGATGRVTVDGPGSALTLSGALRLGVLNGSEGWLSITNGGTVSDGYFSYVGSSGVGMASVDGNGSAWTSSADITVGGNNKGTLTISNGGAVSNDNSMIARSAGASGSTVTVDGVNSTWTSYSTVYIGMNGGSGAMTLSNGCKADITQGIVMGFNGGQGTLNIGAPLEGAAAAPATLDTPYAVLGEKGVGMLNFNHTDTSGTYSFNAELAGSGTVTQAAGVTVLTADSSAYYKGTVTVSGGTLDVEGSIASSSLTTVNTGATLMGAGAVGNTIIDSGGTLAPGSGAPGTSLQVQGDLTFAAGANYAVKIDGTQARLADVTGTATLDGATVQMSFATPPPALQAGDEIILMKAGAMTSPASATAVAGGYIFDLAVKNNQLIASMQAAAPVPAPAPGPDPANPVAVPTLNPATLALLTLALAALAFWHRRRA